MGQIFNTFYVQKELTSHRTVSFCFSFFASSPCHIVEIALFVQAAFFVCASISGKLSINSETIPLTDRKVVNQFTLAYLVSGHYKSETFSCSLLLVRQSKLIQGIALGCDNDTTTRGTLVRG